MHERKEFLTKENLLRPSLSIYLRIARGSDMENLVMECFPTRMCLCESVLDKKWP